MLSDVDHKVYKSVGKHFESNQLDFAFCICLNIQEIAHHKQYDPKQFYCRGKKASRKKNEETQQPTILFPAIKLNKNYDGSVKEFKSSIACRLFSIWSNGSTRLDAYLLAIIHFHWWFNRRRFIRNEREKKAHTQ